jgi:hypothetical protein
MSGFRSAAEIVGSAAAAKQCPTCGHCPPDWAEKSGTIKGKQRGDWEDRLRDYRQWRFGLGNGCYVADVDQVEWRLRDGERVPVALFEMSRVDGNVSVPDTYLKAVLVRLLERDQQGHAAKTFAKALGCKAWIVLFRWDMTEFWVYNLTDDRGWWRMGIEHYRRWLEGL